MRIKREVLDLVNTELEKMPKLEVKEKRKEKKQGQKKSMELANHGDGHALSM
ncbi:hypothetical protein [Pedobacter miscanthi]|nr:hypothetical protein [Pedobacter miscanthi]